MISVALMITVVILSRLVYIEGDYEDWNNHKGVDILVDGIF